MKCRGTGGARSPSQQRLESPGGRLGVAPRSPSEPRLSLRGPRRPRELCRARRELSMQLLIHSSYFNRLLERIKQETWHRSAQPAARFLPALCHSLRDCSLRTH